MRRRFLTAAPAALLAIAAVALALAGSGCGSSSATLDPVAQAAETTNRAAGFRMQLTANVSVPVLPGAITLDGNGFFNPASREGSMTMSFAGMPGIAGTLSMHEVFKTTTVYVQSSLFAGKLPGGARWMKIDLARFGQSLGLDAQSLTSGGTNPAEFLEFLKASSGGVTRVGQETVRGVQTTRYRATVDLEKVADSLPSSQRAAVHQALSKLTAQLGVHTLPIEVWIDSHDMARRIALSMSIPEQGQTARFALSMDLFDFGQTPAVQVPPASETYEPSSSSLGNLGG
jgi:hypothetical protein